MKVQPKPTVEKYSGRWWKNEITRAEERRKKFIEAAEESIRVYNAQKQVGVLNDAERRLNVWWYCTNTLLPAYYSSTPKAEVNLRKRSGSLPYELGSVVLERNAQYAMDVHFDFDKIGYQASLQFLLTGQAVLWARYVAEFETVYEEYAVIRDPEGKLIDGDGNDYEGDEKELEEREGGILIGGMQIQKKTSERAILEVVQYNDYYCNDARSEAEIDWQARKAFMDRSQAESMFGPEIADQLSYDSYPEVIKKDIARQDDRYEGKAELYEIWDRPSRKVYWLQKGGDKTLIETSEPPIRFEKFFPCSVIRQSADPDSVIPVSDYSHVKDQILEVERLTTRIHAVTQAIRTNSLYDATLGNQVEMLMTGDLKLIPVTNWPSYKQRGGLANGIESMNIEPYINALNILQGARQNALQQLYETLKVSDLLRGTSEQYKSATANRLENQWSSMGLIVRQNMFAKFVSDSISNLATIIAEVFEPETIFDVADADALIEPTLPPPPPPPPAPEPMPQDETGMMPPMPEMAPPMPPPYDPLEEIDRVKGQILEILRDDKKRSYRIQIATDSMMAIDQQQQQQEATMLIQTAGAFFDQMRGLIDQYPPLIDFSISLFQNMIKRYKGGKEIDGLFTKALTQIGEISKAKEEAAKQPPPLDPVMQEVQGRLQIAQIESQARLQVTQMEMQDKSTKNQLSYQDQQLKMQRDQLETQLRVQDQQFEQYVKQQELSIAQQEIQIKQSSIQVDMLKVQAMTQSDGTKHEITAEHNRMQGLLEVHKLEAQQMQFRLGQQEKLMEERRLQQEQQLEQIRINMQETKNFNANNSIQSSVRSSSKKRKAELVNDENGNPVSIKISEEPIDRKLITDENGNLIGMEF